MTPDVIDPGGRLTVYYRINNPNSTNLTIGLGASIRLNGTGTWISDPDDDVYRSCPPGESIQTRYFDVLSGSTPGSYDVAWGLHRDFVQPMYDNLEKTNQFIVDDAYEDNDSRTTAYDLSSWEQTWLSSINGLGIQADDDWYRISVTSAYERVLVDCRFTHTEGDIDIALYDSSGSWLDSSESTSDNEYIDFIVPSSGTYYIKVYYDDEGNFYDLWWDDIQPPPPPDLYPSNPVYEIHNSAEPGEALWNWAVDVTNDPSAGPLTDSWQMEFVLSDDTIIGDADDHAIGGPWTMNEDFDPGQTRLFSGDYIVPASISLAGYYYYGIRLLNVTGETNTSNNTTYNADSIWIQTVDVDPFEDEWWLFENNDTSGEATDLNYHNGGPLQGAVSWSGLTIDAKYDDDWHKFTTAASGSVTVTVDDFVNGEGDLDLYVYDTSLVLIESSTLSGNSESVTFTVAAATWYYVKVIGYQGDISYGSDFDGYRLALVTPVPQADLTKDTDNISQTSAFPGDTLNCTLTIKNIQPVQANAGYIYYYWKKDSASYTDPYKVGEDSYGSLAYNETSSESFSFIVPAGTTPGTYKLYYWIDATDTTSENNEDNNKWEWTVTVNQATQILSVDHNPPDPTSGTVDEAKTVQVIVGAEIAQPGVLQVWMYDDDFSTQDTKWVYISSPQSTVRTLIFRWSSRLRDREITQRTSSSVRM